MSKKIIILMLGCFAALASNAQPGKFNQNNNRQRYYGLMSDTMQGLPKDTFRVNINVAAYKNYSWLSSKNNKLFLWDTANYRFNHIGYDSIYVRTSTDSVFGRYYGTERFLYLKTAGAGVYVDTIFNRNDTLIYKKNGVEFAVRKITDAESVQDVIGLMVNASLTYYDVPGRLTIADRDFGDIITSDSGTVWTIGEHAVSYDQIQNVSAPNRLLGRIYSTGSVEELSGADVMTMLDIFTDVANGIVPASGGGSSNFLRADGTWAAPPGGAGTDNTNLGSGFRLVVPSSQGIKSLFNGFAVSIDSTSNTNGLTYKADTTSGGLTSWVRTKKVIDSLNALGAFSSQRFGIEDNTSSVNRLMDMSNHDFTIDSSSNMAFHLKKDNASRFDIYAAQGFYAEVRGVNSGFNYWGYYDLWDDFNYMYVSTGNGENYIQQDVSNTTSRLTLQSLVSGAGSQLWLYNDEIRFKQPQGTVLFDSLTHTTDTTGFYLVVKKRGSTNADRIMTLPFSALGGGTQTLQQVFDVQTGEALMNKPDTINLAANKMSVKNGEFYVDTLEVTDAIFDVNKNKLISFTTVASAAVQIEFINAVAGGVPIISVGGSDINTNLAFRPKGDGKFLFSANSSHEAQLQLYEDLDNGGDFITLRVTPSLSPTTAVLRNVNSIDTIAYLSDVRAGGGGGGGENLDATMAIGSTLTTNRTIVLGANRLFITKTSSSLSALDINSSVTGGTALTTYAKGNSVEFTTEASNTGSPVTPLQLFAATTGTANTGFGARIAIGLESNDGSSSTNSESIDAVFASATAGSEITNFNIRGRSVGVTKVLMNIQPLGIIRVNDNADTLATLAQMRASEVGGGGALNLSWDAANHEVDISGGGTSAVIPFATTSASGLVSTAAQSFDGYKTFIAGIEAGGITSNVLNAQTNSFDVLLLKHESTGTPAPGFGSAVAVELETTPGNNETGAYIIGELTDVTAASEDFDWTFRLMAAGATAAEKFRILSTGEIKVQLLNNDDTETKIVMWNSTDKIFEYRTLASFPGGGSGTVNTGAALKAAFFPSAGTAVDDWIGVEFGNTNLNTKILVQASTDVGLEIKAASSQTANLAEINSSGGSGGDLFKITSDGYARAVRGSFGGAASYPLHVYGGSDGGARGPLYITGNTGTIGVGLSLDAGSQGGAGWSLFSAGSGAGAPAGSWALYLISTGYRQSQKSTGELAIGQDFFDYAAMLNVKATTGINVANFHAIEAEDAIIGLKADDGDDNADNWYFKSEASTNDLSFFNNTTEKFRILNDGTIKVQLLNQDDAETKVVVWNSTDKIFEWRASSTLGGGSSTFAALTDVNLTSITTNDFLKWDGTDWINRSPSQVRTDLSLVVGTNVQAWDADLDTWATLNSANFATLTGTETLSGKTLTAPKIANGGFIADANGNELIIFTTTASAINEVTFANAASGNNPQWAATGGGTDIGINWLVKGAGKFNFLASASGPAEVRLFEDSDNGTNYIGLIGQGTLGANRTITFPDATGTVVLEDNTATLTNKRVTPRNNTVASSSSLTIDSDANDVYTVTALSAAMTINNPSGTPTEGQKLIIRIKDNGTARGLTWSGSQFRAGDIAFPTTTVLSKTMYVGLIWNSTDSKWDLIAYIDNL